MTDLLETYGLILLFVLIMLESGGIPLPGETALIAASILASQGHFDVWAVIAVAAAAAILGDNGGYWVGRKWGRKILGRWLWLERLAERTGRTADRAAAARGARRVLLRRDAALLAWPVSAALALNHLIERLSERVLPPSERFFARHGAKTVFVGRFVAILRFTAAWMAGVSRMTWWKFLFWNAVGGIAWASLVALVAFYGGKAAAHAINRYGLMAGLPAIAIVLVAWWVFHRFKRRLFETAQDEA